MNQIFDTLSQSPLFTGVLVLLMNMGTRYLYMESPKGFDMVFQHYWVKVVVVFAILYMSLRSIPLAAFFILIYVLVTRFLLNEKSRFFILKEHYENYQKEKKVTDMELMQARQVMQKWSEQNKCQ